MNELNLGMFIPIYCTNLPNTTYVPISCFKKAYLRSNLLLVMFRKQVKVGHQFYLPELATPVLMLLNHDFFCDPLSTF